ncbi:dTDP-glucose pyrophosphorylase [Nodosilinea sp. FACHB-131]|uniref:nucleotidyltransferase family protein n=1 Tax=Cyanophyceae TaxID=3028117 RepID=UPI0016856BEF|nr:sugar phosphate nucleotidyltransferase [Nodosilinea sp. FACHB-131]MBD1876682.1 dTDP-glucose pyrophosphorylase [Nodosilinea sp. FACHB-131]
MPTSLPTIGLIPAAGQGTRISPLPMSKELFPIGFRMLTNQSGPRPKVVCHYLLEKMRRAGVEQAFFILRSGKWDIPNFLGDGADLGMHLSYLTVHVPFGVPFSLNQAYPFLRGATVVLGFPDILFEPGDAYQVLLERLHGGTADVVLGLFPTDQPEKVGVVDFDESGVVRGIYEKSGLTHLPYMWAIAAWRPSFSDFLHGFVRDRQQALIGTQIPQHLTILPPYTEVPIGDVMQAALASGLRIEAQPFTQGSYLDIGTPENLARAIQQHPFPVG